MARKFLIDTDTASDDAVAIMMALRWPDVQVLAITMVAGNMPIKQGAINALYTAQLCESDVPVYLGSDRPLTREALTAEWYHGDDGMGNMHYPAPDRQPNEGDAIDIIINTIRANPGITLVTLGPLTNIARALQRQPGIADQVGRCVIMGGAPGLIGNITPAAEYNIWCDPEAAHIVFHSGLPIEMVSWNLALGEANLLEKDITQIRALDNERAHFTIDCNHTLIQANEEQTGEQGISLFDPVAMAVALDPAVCTLRSKCYVDIETQSELTRGMTVVDQLNNTNTPWNEGCWGAIRSKEPNAEICWKLDVPHWKEMLLSVLR